MTEDDARDWVARHYGFAAIDKLEKLVNLLAAESRVQNLIAPSTVGTMWSRHVVDSAQLLPLVPAAATSGRWIDVGSGAGFPGLVIACLTDFETTLVEPRTRRADFLKDAVAALDLADRVTVFGGKIERLISDASVISARAVATLDSVFSWASHLANPQTCWVLPKGRGAREEVETAKQAWHGTFHVEHSITDPDSLIVLASGVTRR